MKQIKALFLISTLICIGTLISCNKRSQTTDTILFDSIVFNEKIPMLEKVDTLLPYSDVNISFNYPVKFEGTEELNRLQQIFIGTFFNNIDLDELSPQDAMKEYISNYEDDYKSLSNYYYSDKSRLEEGNTPQWYWYFLNLSNKVLFQNDKLLCNAVEYSDYTGGAHGSYFITYTNIDLKNLVTISEEDIFVPDYQKPLAEIIVNRLMIQNNVNRAEELLSVGFFDIDDIFPNNNFWISDEAIHYAFNQYEIAPYVMGVINVDIPLEDITQLLKSEDSIEKFLR